jgi:hypothetical protein
VIALYFGCPCGVAGHRDAGHFYYDTKMRSRGLGRDATTGPWGGGIDSKLAPREWDSHRAPEMPQGVAALHHKDGWTALAFWDRSGDSRPNSNSAFLFDETLDFDAALAAAREHFPALFERFPFEVRPTASAPARKSEGDAE